MLNNIRRKTIKKISKHLSETEINLCKNIIRMVVFVSKIIEFNERASTQKYECF